MKKENNIPSEEDFARAKKYMEERYRNLNSIEDAVKAQFSALCPLHSLYLLAQEDVDFRMYVFFKLDKNIAECREKGILSELEDFVYREFEKVGRGTKNEITVVFEYDSDENVAANYEEDYYLRLR